MIGKENCQNSWIDKYKEKVTSKEQAIHRIQSGQNVFLAPFCNEPQTLVEELGAKKVRFHDLKMFNVVGGTIPRITQSLSSVTSLKSEIDYIVTEYGVAELFGKTLKERKEALIAIAHPDFRDQLADG